jgi:hypothetical protein
MEIMGSNRFSSKTRFDPHYIQSPEVGRPTIEIFENLHQTSDPAGYRQHNRVAFTTNHDNFVGILRFFDIPSFYLKRKYARLEIAAAMGISKGICIIAFKAIAYTHR